MFKNNKKKREITKNGGEKLYYKNLKQLFQTCGLNRPTFGLFCKKRVKNHGFFSLDFLITMLIEYTTQNFHTKGPFMTLFCILCESEVLNIRCRQIFTVQR